MARFLLRFVVTAILIAVTISVLTGIFTTMTTGQYWVTAPIHLTVIVLAVALLAPISAGYILIRLWRSK